MVLIDDNAESGRPASLRFVRPDVAIVVHSGTVTLASQSTAGSDHEAVQTFVLVKNDSVWRIAGHHNTSRQVQS